MTFTFLIKSGRPGSNRPPSAWKADALPNELLPLNLFKISDYLFRIPVRNHNFSIHVPFPFLSNPKSQILNPQSRSGERRIRTFEVETTDLQSVPFGHSGISPTVSTKKRADGGIRTPDQLITNQLLWPTELHRLIPKHYILKNFSRY